MGTKCTSPGEREKVEGKERATTTRDRRGKRRREDEGREGGKSGNAAAVRGSLVAAANQRRGMAASRLWSIKLGAGLQYVGHLSCAFYSVRSSAL